MKSKTKICPYCKTLISTTSHLLKCNPNVDIDISYINMIEITYNCKVENIVNEYVNGFSLPDIKLKYNLPYKTTTKLLKIYGITCRTIKESCNEDRIKKSKKTCLIKYGVDNVSKSSIVKDKKAQTFIRNYGIDNIFRTDGFAKYVTSIMIEKYGKARNTNGELISKKRLEFSDKKWKDIQDKTKKTIQEKYGNINENIWKYSSSLEDIVKNVLDKNNIVYKPQKFVSGRSYDIHILNTNILIEINGDYWHANPKLYNDGEMINYAGKGKCLVNEIWDKDTEKLKIANDSGFDVIYLWEFDINYHILNNTLDKFVLNNLINK